MLLFPSLLLYLGVLFFLLFVLYQVDLKYISWSCGNFFNLSYHRFSFLCNDGSLISVVEDIRQACFIDRCVCTPADCLTLIWYSDVESSFQIGGDLDFEVCQYVPYVFTPSLL